MLKLTTMQQQVYNLLHEQLTAHGNISITRETIASHLNLSISTIRRATDFIIDNNLSKYNLDNIYAGYIGNFIYYSLQEIPDNISEVDIHVIQSLPCNFKYFEDEQEF